MKEEYERLLAEEGVTMGQLKQRVKYMKYDVIMMSSMYTTVETCHWQALIGIS